MIFKKTYSIYRFTNINMKMSSLIERIKEKEVKYNCKQYYEYVKYVCKENKDECKQLKKLVQQNCNQKKNMRY